MSISASLIVYNFPDRLNLKFTQNNIVNKTEEETGYKPIFSAYSSKNVKFHLTKEERVEELLEGDFFELLKGEEKKKYFDSIV